MVDWMARVINSSKSRYYLSHNFYSSSRPQKDCNSQKTWCNRFDSFEHSLFYLRSKVVQDTANLRHYYYGKLNQSSSCE